ncbi:MAG: tRNA (adenosine(37)-N6)-threonylcarbamoyltransferase complex dimerization subunit type 1 TsaB [Clostridiales bacterium]|jgi:tRNA threonylcarbamoyl adenosine modification protein YeaZ|nr:tRNA (adenosine(37)-N6)-threonylcarbamoyltransferase complex dimerization subunit type 1 TsaB [Clostridiales bacterium]
MNVLIVDSTREILLTALICGGKNYVRKSLQANAKHMSLLFIKIDELLKEAGIDVGDVDCFAGVVGPGSYTGIRIGVCALNAMARANEKKLVALNSLEILAYRNRALGEYTCLIDNAHDYYAMESKANEARYFIAEKSAVASLKNAVIRDENEYYIDEIIELTKIKIDKGEFSNILLPFYMKKSQAGQLFSNGFTDKPDAIL